MGYLRFEVVRDSFFFQELMALRFNASMLPKSKAQQEERKSALFKEAAAVVWDRLFKKCVDY